MCSTYVGAKKKKRMKEGGLVEQIPSVCTLNKAGEVAFPGYLIQTRFLAFGGDVLLLLLARLHITKRENNKRKSINQSTHPSKPITSSRALGGTQCTPAALQETTARWGACPGSADLRVFRTMWAISGGVLSISTVRSSTSTLYGLLSISACMDRRPAAARIGRATEATSQNNPRIHAANRG
ncbi:hypothetical protein EDB80DRAFT_10807 [Ilyonectria destructans]|nr:hypothetical protein EDB80DRAFT_10807 [Ilyonectria destructans]